MLLSDNAIFILLLDWLAHGLWPLSWWQLALYVLLSNHLTIVAESIFLHRCQSHRALTLGPVPSHFFRFWLWLTTGMTARKWVAVHRKHHAKSDLPDDPHSPQQRGLWPLLWRGAEIFWVEAANDETLRIYGQATVDDWLERRLYSRRPRLGIQLLLVIDLLLFGIAGLAVCALTILANLFCHGSMLGLLHYRGYRNFEVPDASCNISPWGLLLAGEELHNNHHTYPTSAKLSVRRYEFDIGWGYIWLLQRLGWAHVKRLPPRWRQGEIKAEADEATLDALIANRYEVMARYARVLRAACGVEIQGLKARRAGREEVFLLQAVRRRLVRDQERLPQLGRAQIATVRAAHPTIDQMLIMREELRQLWLNRSLSRQQLTADLQAWCRKAEDSGIQALKDFSLMLRAVHV